MNPTAFTMPNLLRAWGSVRQYMRPCAECPEYQGNRGGASAREECDCPQGLARSRMDKILGYKPPSKP